MTTIATCSDGDQGSLAACSHWHWQGADAGSSVSSVFQEKSRTREFLNCPSRLSSMRFCALHYIAFAACVNMFSSAQNLAVTDEGLRVNGDLILVGTVAFKSSTSSLSITEPFVGLVADRLVIAVPEGQTLQVSGNASVHSSHQRCSQTQSGVFAEAGALLVCGAGPGGFIELWVNASTVQDLTAAPSSTGTWRACPVSHLGQARAARLRATTRLMPATMPVRSAYGVTVDSSGMLLAGGKTASDTRLNDVWQSTDHGATWTLATAAGEYPAVADFGMCANGSHAFIVGGSTCGQTGLSNQIWATTNSGRNWTRQQGFLPKRQGFFTGCVVSEDNTALMFHQGCGTFSGTACDSSCSYGKGVEHWRGAAGTTTLNNPDTATHTRAYVQLTGTASRAVYSGGRQASGSDSEDGHVWVTMDVGRSWTELTVPWATAGVHQRALDSDGSIVGYGAAAR